MSLARWIGVLSCVGISFFLSVCNVYSGCWWEEKRKEASGEGSWDFLPSCHLAPQWLSEQRSDTPTGPFVFLLGKGSDVAI